MTEQVPSDSLFRFHWLDGKKSEGKGRDAAEAINRLGFGRGALRALDYWELVPEPGNVALPGDTVASQGGLLSRLKRYAEQNAREPWIPVKAPELLALVECAELLDSVIEAQFTHAGQSEWLRKRKEVLAKLEAL